MNIMIPPPPSFIIPPPPPSAVVMERVARVGWIIARVGLIMDESSSSSVVYKLQLPPAAVEPVVERPLSAVVTVQEARVGLIKDESINRRSSSSSMGLDELQTRIQAQSFEKHALLVEGETHHVSVWRASVHCHTFSKVTALYMALYKATR